MPFLDPSDSIASYGLDSATGKDVAQLAKGPRYQQHAQSGQINKTSWRRGLGGLPGVVNDDAAAFKPAPSATDDMDTAPSQSSYNVASTRAPVGWI
ncbi:uncharacterized protein UV8b_01622 [Ustilaginoidea virens]|uniref:Uncharacterized protein n=1 Tax=Ustilaginoidea virens TaxID=1159556 RepID=A0A8E5HL01_USTVR|nr:uncharacterized protein UV8b_01622 [Ustilaginoidea virens]QUC17381.1 hypothetical protein UV8b_01622 [Ustilaginoidea virens]